MEEIVWKEDFSVGVKVIDLQHKQFVSLMNQVYNALTEPAPAAKIHKLLDELAKYGTYHFATEEKFFDELNYPEADIHKEEHRRLLAKITEFLTQKDRDIMELGFELLDFLEDWLVNHLSSMDKKYTKWFNEHGVS